MNLYSSGHSPYSTASRTPLRHQILPKPCVRPQEFESACLNNILPLDHSQVISIDGGELHGATHSWRERTDRQPRYMIVGPLTKLQFEAAA